MLAARPERLTAWVEEAIARLAESTELDGERPLRVYLSPQDLEQLGACDLSVAQPVEWKADPALAPGEARVESDASAVRVGLEAGVREVRRSLREVLGYYLYQDLRRGWRITSPNLEQCGLLEIDYLSLTRFCADQVKWHERHIALASAQPEDRERVCRVVLGFLRRELAVRVSYLDSVEQLNQYLPYHTGMSWKLARWTKVAL